MPHEMTREQLLEEVELLQRRVMRERAARKEAERLLETKSRELWEANVSLAEAVKQLEDHASRDPLTGVANRRALSAWIDIHARHGISRGKTVGVLNIDLDKFKEINDAHGHAAGDQVLRTLAARMTDSTRAEDLVVRSGGDEFTVLLGNVSTLDGARKVALKVLSETQQPIMFNSGTVKPSISIGVALHHTGEDPERVLTAADTAMYRAKKQGGGVIELEFA